jgi:predicted glycosyltransferase
VHAAAAALPQVSVQDFSDDMMSLMGAADVVVAMGGYNTVCELLTLGRRAVLVPRMKPGLEQFIRAQRMSAAGLVHMLHPERLSPGALMDAVQTELAALGTPAKHPRLRALDGLERTTAAMLELIGIAAPPSAANARHAPTAQARPHSRHDNNPSATPWLKPASTATAPLAC